MRATMTAEGFLVFASIVLWTAAAYAAPPLMNAQGRLTTNALDTLSTGTLTTALIVEGSVTAPRFIASALQGTAAFNYYEGDSAVAFPAVTLNNTESNNNWAVQATNTGNLELVSRAGDYDVRITGAGDFSADLLVEGTTQTCVLEITGGCDLAEPFSISSQNVIPGTVLIIDVNHPGQLAVSTQPYDSKVAGVVSGAGGIQPGLTLKQTGVMEGTHNLALSGRVYVLASTCNGAIHPGDRLTTSYVPGHCMRATDPSKCDGAVIGKAMSFLEVGEGLVLVLVNLQ